MAHIEVGQQFVGRALAGLPTRQRSALEVAANVGALRRALELADGPITPAIHPYIDGNGLVRRALTHLVLRRRHVVRDGIATVSIAVLADRDGYFDRLRRYEQGDADGFTRSFARSCQTAAAASRQLQRDLGALRREWRELPGVTGTRSDATIRKLVEQRPTTP